MYIVSYISHIQFFYYYGLFVCRLNNYMITSPFSLLSLVSSYNFHQDFFPISVDTSVAGLSKCLSLSLP